jgi:hypothetical protein
LSTEIDQEPEISGISGFVAVPKMDFDLGYQTAGLGDLRHSSDAGTPGRTL